MTFYEWLKRAYHWLWSLWSSKKLTPGDYDAIEKMHAAWRAGYEQGRNERPE